MDDNLRFWQRTAKLYSLIQERSNRKLYDTMTEKIARVLDYEDSVLELACGSGQLAITLSGYVHSWIATDFSERMVSECQRRCSSCRAEVQDATALSYPDSSFDVVVVANALHVMPAPELALKEIRRVLRRGGYLIAPTFVYEEPMRRGRLKLMEGAGLRTFHKWNCNEYRAFLKEQGFEEVSFELIEASPLPECFLMMRR